MSILLSNLRFGAAALVVAAALAACGGSSPPSSSGGQSTGPSTGSPSTNAAATTATGSGSPTTTGTSTTAPPAGTTGAVSVSACPTASLRLSFVSGQGAAGTAYMTYALTNVRASTCSLYGYPGVSILDAAGHIVQHPAQRGGIQAPTAVHLVTLAKGSQARFILISSDVIPSPGCSHAFTGTTLQVFPPNQRAALTLAHRGSFCNLHVGPVQAAR